MIVPRCVTVRDFLDQRYYRKKVNANGFENFREKLNKYLDCIRETKGNCINASEDSLVSDALKEFFKGLKFCTKTKYKIHGKSEIDLVITGGGGEDSTQETQIKVIIEAKVPESGEYINSNDFNVKAFHQAILYYFSLREDSQILHDPQYIIITNFLSCFIFKCEDFKKYFYKNIQLKKLYEKFKDPRNQTIKTTDDFYKETSKIIGNLFTLHSQQLDLFNSKGEEVAPDYLEYVYVDFLEFLNEDLQEKDNKNIESKNLLNNKEEYKTTQDSNKEAYTPTLHDLYRVFHRDFLLQEFNYNDANVLNEKFYNELLYILGLCEVKKQGKILILPSKESKEKKGTLYCHIVVTLYEKGELETDDITSEINEQAFEILILWLNRLLFLKLLEASLISFNDNKDLAFLNLQNIPTYTVLNNLFFNVLAKVHKERGNLNISENLRHLPYLNSSLFTPNEKEIIEIKDLETFERELEVFPYTQVYDVQGRKLTGEKKWLEYFFSFLDAFDFGIIEDNNNIYSNQMQKELINASVLGLVFEKLNGYKEGSFYTPSFITSYMCEEALSKVVIQKFNTIKPEWNAKSLESIEDEIRHEIRKGKDSLEKDEIRQKYEKVLESIRICDPSVGSGHFLVSSLNYMIVIYYRLGLLNSLRLSNIEIINDELEITKDDNTAFSYKKPKLENDSNHIIQKRLFKLKQTIIENNLFGVDINENSVNIARLRLWIELLKNTYYTELNIKEHHLQTLPNIDINIKCGNSLLSYFPLEISIFKNFSMSKIESKNIKNELSKYAKLTAKYKTDLEDKNKTNKEIQSLKQMCKNFFANAIQFQMNHEEKIVDFLITYGDSIFNFETPFGMHVLSIQQKVEGRKYQLSLGEDLYTHTSKPLDKKGKILLQQIQNEYEILKSIRSDDGFEWRYEFPEILYIEQLDYNKIAQKNKEKLEKCEGKNTQAIQSTAKELQHENGKFLGFDLVIGNPPYIRQEEIKELKPHLMLSSIIENKEITLKRGFEIYKGTSDIYTYFYEQGYKILAPNGILSFITSNKWVRSGYGEPLREFVLKNTELEYYVELNGIKVFDHATVDTSIFSFKKKTPTKESVLCYMYPKDFNPKKMNITLKEYMQEQENTRRLIIKQNTLSKESFSFEDDAILKIKAKIEKIGTPLKDWDIAINYGIKTGYNEAFIISTEKREEILNACDDKLKDSMGLSERDRTEELIKPILRGKDIKRYSYEWAGLWVIVAKFGSHEFLEIEYPAIYNHLLQYKDKLEQRGQCRYSRGIQKTNKPYPGQHHWLELDNNPKDSYLQEFAKEKIVYSEIVREPQFYLDSGEFKFKHFYAEASSFILTGEHLHYLLGILHSKFITFAFKTFYAGGGLGKSGYRYKKAFLERLPIPKINKQQEQEFSTLVKQILESKKQNKDAIELEQTLNNHVYNLYGLNDIEIALINGGG